MKPTALRLSLATVAIALALTGCQRVPRLDATSPTTLRETADRMRAELPPAGQKEYDRAVTLIVASVLNPIETLTLAERGSIPTQANVFERIRPAFNDKSLDDLFSAARTSEEVVRGRLDQWSAREQRLQHKKRLYDETLPGMLSVVAEHVELLPTDTPMPAVSDNLIDLDITIRNNMDEPLSRAEFQVALMPPGIDNPWVTQQVQRKFDDPIPVGGTAQLKVGPIVVSVPEAVEGDITLEAQVHFTRLEGAAGDIRALPIWTTADVVELARLQAASLEISSLLATNEPLKTQQP